MACGLVETGNIILPPALVGRGTVILGALLCQKSYCDSILSRYYLANSGHRSGEFRQARPAAPDLMEICSTWFEHINHISRAKLIFFITKMTINSDQVSLTDDLLKLFLP